MLSRPDPCKLYDEMGVDFFSTSDFVYIQIWKLAYN